MYKGLSLKRTTKTFLLTMLLLLSFCLPAFAGIVPNTVNGQETDASRQALATSVNAAVSAKSYQTTKGGYYQGGDLVDSERGLVNEKAFGDLTSKSKRQLLEDMNQAVNRKIDEDKQDTSPSAVSDDTKTNWLQELQQTNGIGTQLMNNILAQTKPDFVKANKIYAPFASPLGVVLGLLCILIGAGVTLSMALDLAWMAIPLFRGFTEGDGEKGGQNGPKYISYEARSAVQEAESGNDSGKGGNKVAVLLYFKKRVIMLIVLGVCLLYLVQGEIFTLVSWILDLVSGVIGF